MRLDSLRSIAGIKTLVIGGVCAAAIALSGCTTTAYVDETAKKEANDPIEGVNRSFFAVNEQLDNVAIEPVARGYRKAVDPGFRIAIHNFFRNLGEPVTFVNDVLQGNLGRASKTFGRATINSTIGFLGVADAAGAMGIPYHHEDFGQTLAVWGIPEGPYLFFPLIGPKPPRDLIGGIVDVFANPFFWANEPIIDGVMMSKPVVQGIDIRERNLENLDRLEETSVDFYASIRSLYRQRREYEIRNGESNFEDLPDLEQFN